MAAPISPPVLLARRVSSDVILILLFASDYAFLCVGFGSDDGDLDGDRSDG